MECEQILNVLFFIYRYIDLTNIRHKLIPLFETDFCQVVGLVKRNEKFYAQCIILILSTLTKEMLKNIVLVIIFQSQT